MTEWAYTVAGFAVGFVVGLTGVGGGSLMTPLLIFGFGVKPHLAVGTDLLFAAATKFTGTVHHMRQRTVPWRVVGALCLGSVPSALITLWALHQVGPASAQAARVITTTLGAALLLTAVATAVKAWRTPWRALAQSSHDNITQDAETPRHAALPVLMGAVLGVLVTLTSVGAGAIGVMALMLMYPRLPLPRLVAADIAYAVPLTLVSGLGHASMGSVNWPLLGWLLAGSLPGIWLGSRLIHKTPERLVRTLLSVLMSYAGLKLIAL
jgi:uncharacterized protein